MWVKTFIGQKCFSPKATASKFRGFAIVGKLFDFVGVKSPGSERILPAI
jgi:hypothetical protein